MWRTRIRTWTWIAVCLFFLAFGIGSAVDDAYSLPRKYAHLRDRGVPVAAQFAGWRGFGRDRAPWLTLDYAGHRRTWRYPNDERQFAGLARGAPVALLVDPRDWTVAYTTRDVEHDTNAGLSPPFFFGIGLACVGLGGLVWEVRFRRRLRYARTSGLYLMR